jgi:hypothetical protein
MERKTLRWRLDAAEEALQVLEENTPRDYVDDQMVCNKGYGLGEGVSDVEEID